MTARDDQSSYSFEEAADRLGLATSDIERLVERRELDVASEGLATADSPSRLEHLLALGVYEESELGRLERARHEAEFRLRRFLDEHGDELSPGDTFTIQVD